MVQPGELTATIGKLGKLFKDASCYLAAIPTYVGGFMAMGFATDDKTLRRATESMIAARYRKAGRFPTKYWTPAIHKAAFALPRFIEELVAKAKS
jgi:spermidine synthase